jgi:hypothetical protein
VPGRRVAAPRNVTVASLADTGDPATDRVMIQAEQNLQDLQEKARAAAATAAAQATAIAAIPTGGRLLGVVLLTGSGSGTLPAGTAAIRFRGTGQGGGGGGATTGAGIAAGAGGSTGEIVEGMTGTPGGTPLTVTAYSWIGGTGAGAGGTSAGGNGATGTASTFTANGVAYTASGGGGGQGIVGVAGNANTNPTTTATGTPAVGVSGVLRRASGLGLDGEMHDGTMWISGSGGCHEMGTGGVTVGGLTAGNPGTGMGGGGGGAAAGGGGGRAGGDGAPGGWIVEFYS